MRLILAVLAILFSLTFSAHSNVESGNELLSSCQSFLGAYRPSGGGFTLEPEDGVDRRLSRARHQRRSDH
jgi:hypothetical protein